MFIRSSPKRYKQFERIVSRHKLTTKLKPKLDVRTRWNSTYDMVDSMIPYINVVADLWSETATNNKQEFPRLTQEDWTVASAILSFLKPFRTWTTKFSTTTEPTAHLFLQCIVELNGHIKSNVDSSNPIIAQLAAPMVAKFDKYWENLNLYLVCAAVMDPRLKLKYVKYAFRKLNPGKPIAETFAQTETFLFTMFKSYSSQYNLSPPCTESPERDDYNDGWREFDECASDSEDEDISSELIIYLREKRCNLSPNFNVLEWWKNNTDRFPVLSNMARDLLSIPLLPLHLNV